MALPALGLDPWSLLGLFLFQLLQLLLPTTAEGGGQGSMPRVKYYAGDGRRALGFFHQKGLQDFDSLLLSGDRNTLYVGAREAILALNIQDPGVPRLKNMIPWPASDKKKSECTFKKKSNETQCFNFIRVLVSFNATHLYACGTFAFSPACTFIELQDSSLLSISEVMEGKGQSPFDPAHKHTAVLVDGMLYSGTMNNFLGSEPILMRTLGSQPILKTDTFLRWLHPDASFVAAIPSTQVVYFFFEETASELDFFEKLHTSRVAQVCKNDVGGEKLLQKKWTTFLKAQLLCTQPGQLPFNVIRHAVLLPSNSSTAPHIYAVFTSQWQVGGTKSSAVCAFSLTDIERVFKGKYKELNKETSRWTTYRGPETNPRPGSCSVGPSSDKALTFMKDHFLMDEQVMGMPLLVKSGVEYTQLAVEITQGLDGRSYLVMYLGTTTGSLHKAVVSGESSAHLVEEIQLFPDPEPVRNLLLAPAQGAVFVGFSGGVLRVPRANCSVYESCVDCILARDPHCAWDPKSQICGLLSSHNLNFWKQDMEQGNPGWACTNGPLGRSLRPQSRPRIIKEVLAVPSSILELPCPHPSSLASYHWTRGTAPAPAPEVSSTVHNGSLLLILQDGVGGLYQCWATENGFSYPVVSYWVDSQDQPLALDPELAGIPREHVEVPLTRVSSGAALAAQRSYWPHFLTVTVLLVLVLSGALILLLASPRGALRARGKVQGCGTLPPREKSPLSQEQHLQLPKEHRISASDVDTDNCPGTEVA
ncbi:semaphorin-4A isoform X1 [Nycticebus coucang]|uniref:semaphorin-4A isoform X1 n=2 Tax=Nycticebus coucang TaxID=9470 RepID=UPI00234DFAA6|nr:semaphorin-4A isoform X1 [Nycticebus coucang]XP_053460882.1 semaphorin-4A isoform X1 [Nycticebus coucang]XP_053460883.1 semaphorin-4A isoform X1 [Nycticebus coucang]XP_053460884.1 semaphorin-4A isoform X1 [Nycticebus coucang]XP_053460885.1 semaphorin-4A isoform X1 [Nycticebus coucang]XP_053460886.1 semaphorin-4A isoform X1 [Nycticebus coucang]